MKTKKIFLGILSVSTILFLGLLTHTVHYSDHGPDGLSGFFEAIFFGAAALISMICSISLGAIVFLPNASNSIRFTIAALFSLLTVYLVLALTILPAIRFW